MPLRSCFAELPRSHVLASHRLYKGVSELQIPTQKHYHAANRAPNTTARTPVDDRATTLEAPPVNVAGATGTVCDGGVTVATGGGGSTTEAGGWPNATDVSAAGGGGGGGGGGGVPAAGGGAATLTRGIIAALAMYCSIVLPEVSFWLMTMAMPFWQWLV
jgi:hypothetical protein